MSRLLNKDKDAKATLIEMSDKASPGSMGVAFTNENFTKQDLHFVTETKIGAYSWHGEVPDTIPAGRTALLWAYRRGSTVWNAFSDTFGCTEWTEGVVRYGIGSVNGPALYIGYDCGAGCHYGAGFFKMNQAPDDVTKISRMFDLNPNEGNPKTQRILDAKDNKHIGHLFRSRWRWDGFGMTYAHAFRFQLCAA
eukprot:TRINITY_DN2139_c0_g1_i4.p1 TRINITY_DN2139_c0_g1~~TRINITY_DN2139_c0_g1_i4.p1  ORF type:complete len:194 (+),score=19.48 TRINITY_DN2139_c0_g1_i4:57-638(+)